MKWRIESESSMARDRTGCHARDHASAQAVLPTDPTVTVAQTLHVVHGLMNNVKSVIEGAP